MDVAVTAEDKAEVAYVAELTVLIGSLQGPAADDPLSQFNLSLRLEKMPAAAWATEARSRANALRDAAASDASHGTRSRTRRPFCWQYR